MHCKYVHWKYHEIIVFLKYHEKLYFLKYFYTDLSVGTTVCIIADLLILLLKRYGLYDMIFFLQKYNWKYNISAVLGTVI